MTSSDMDPSDMVSSDTDSYDMGSPGPPRTTFHCSPRHPGESDSAFAQRARAYRNAARQQYVEEYYREREARLPSPQSYDREAQDRAEMVRQVEEDIYWDSRPTGEYWNSYEYPVQRAQRLGIPYVNHDGPLHSLTDDEDEPEDPWEVRSMRPEDREWLDALGIISDRGSPAPETVQEAATSGHEGRDGPEEDCHVQRGPMRSQQGARKRKREKEEREDIQEPGKRARAGADAHAATPGAAAAATPQAATISRHKRKRGQLDDREATGPAKRMRATLHAATSEEVAGNPEARATSRQKRKRGQQEEECSPEARNTRSQSGAKRIRTDSTISTTITARTQLPAIAKPGRKRKRVLDEPQPSQEQAKRRRRETGRHARPLQTSIPASPGLFPATTTSGSGERKRNEPAAEAKESSRTTQPPQVTQTSRVSRAQRRLLSGKEAQLFQLGQHGELDVQDRSGRDASKDVAGKRRSARAGTGTSTKSDFVGKRVGTKGRRAGQRSAAK